MAATCQNPVLVADRIVVWRRAEAKPYQASAVWGHGAARRKSTIVESRYPAAPRFRIRETKSWPLSSTEVEDGRVRSRLYSHLLCTRGRSIPSATGSTNSTVSATGSPLRDCSSTAQNGPAAFTCTPIGKVEVVLRSLHSQRHETWPLQAAEMAENEDAADAGEHARSGVMSWQETLHDVRDGRKNLLWRSCVSLLRRLSSSPSPLTKANVVGFAAAILMTTAMAMSVPGGARAADLLKTCTCLLRECKLELAECIADPKCAANIACLNSCNNRTDETECQIGCGDLFEDSTVDAFNKCAVSEKKCVPQRVDDAALFPVPPSSALVQEFSTTAFNGKWYISKGYNPTFDAFDCQLHDFSAKDPRHLTGKLQWRIKTPDGGSFTRKAVQDFVQDDQQPGLLLNHNNEFLHYEDDWYILAAKSENKPDDYIFVYYRGRNDAWDGYGGAVIYTRSRKVPESAVPVLRQAAAKVGLDFDKFITTDNSCAPQLPLLARLENKIEREVEKEEAYLVRELEDLENREKSLLQKLGEGAKELQRDENLLLQGLSDEEKALLKDLQMGAGDIEKLFGKALPIRRLR